MHTTTPLVDLADREQPAQSLLFYCFIRYDECGLIRSDARLKLRVKHMPTLGLGLHVLKSGERNMENCTNEKRQACWLPLLPVTGLSSKRDMADCVLDLEILYFSRPRYGNPSVELLVPRLLHPVGPGA